MRSIIAIIGIILIIAGVILLYKGFTYTSEERMIKIGNLQLVSEQQKTIYSPYIGGASVVAGIIILVLARTKK